jgi:LmbE family N-acetylglucosaminyl deacetylase
MFSRPGAELFVPDGTPSAQAFSRTTHLGIGAHADDLELMAIDGIVAGYTSEERWFSGVCVTDGAGSPRAAGETPVSDEQIRTTRRGEQKRAAELGRYGALVLLDHPSTAVKDTANEAVVRDLVRILRATRAEVLYTHNLADAHDTHVAVALAVVAACRALDASERPRRVIGCEVWRDLDWLPADAKVAMAVDGHEALETALIRVFESQLGSGKRLDAGAVGRRRANAAFHEIRRADAHEAVVWGMDLTRAAHGELEPAELVQRHLESFASDVRSRLERFARPPNATNDY